MDSKKNRSIGCGSTVLIVLVAIWIISTSIVTQITTWFIEQAIFEGSISGQDYRWAIVLAFGFSQLFPALLIYFLVKNEQMKYLVIAWGLAGFFVVLTSSSRFFLITESLALQIAQVFLFSGFLLLLKFLRKPQSGSGLTTNSLWEDKGWVLTLTMAGLAGIPWVLFGALGSPVDTILALVVGVLFGCIFTQLVLEFAIPNQDQGVYSSGYLLPPLVAFLVSLIMITGIGQNGNQWLLSFTVPFFSILFIFLSRYGITANSPYNRIPPALFIGLLTAWTLVWFDADELMLVIASSPGELFAWALRAVGWTVIIALILSIILLIFRSKVESLLTSQKSTRWVAILTWVGLVAIYFFGDQVGFHGERLFVIFKEQADLYQAYQIENYNERRQYVYNELIQTANQSQMELTGKLDRLRISHTSYYLVNSMEVDGGPLVRLWLSTRPDVDTVLANPILRPLPEMIPAVSGSASKPEGLLWNLELIGADQVWQQGYRGQGIVIGQSDSGVQMGHPELANSYRGSNGDNNYNWYDPWYASGAPVDIGGHGTHTLGTIVGKDVGIAPEAKWIGCVNLARNLGNPAFYLDCMQFMLAPFPIGGDPFMDGKPELGAHIMNNSWGCPETEGCEPDSLSDAVEALRSAGIFVVASAGNSGNGTCGTVKDPIALYDSVYSVGAITQAGDLAPFSSIGPVLVDGSNNTKPDITAPGVDILSAYPNNTYQTASGTSMAGPHVAGVVALLWSGKPDLIGDINKTEEILNRSASQYSGTYPGCVDSQQVPNNAVGYGVVNAIEALNIAIKGSE